MNKWIARLALLLIAAAVLVTLWIVRVDANPTFLGGNGEHRVLLVIVDGIAFVAAILAAFAAVVIAVLGVCELWKRAEL